MTKTAKFRDAMFNIAAGLERMAGAVDRVADVAERRKDAIDNLHSRVVRTVTALRRPVFSRAA